METDGAVGVGFTEIDGADEAEGYKDTDGFVDSEG